MFTKFDSGILVIFMNIYKPSFWVTTSSLSNLLVQNSSKQFCFKFYTKRLNTKANNNPSLKLKKNSLSSNFAPVTL